MRKPYGRNQRLPNNFVSGLLRVTGESDTGRRETKPHGRRSAPPVRLRVRVRTSSGRRVRRRRGPSGNAFSATGAGLSEPTRIPGAQNDSGGLIPREHYRKAIRGWSLPRVSREPPPLAVSSLKTAAVLADPCERRGEESRMNTLQWNALPHRDRCVP
jgi:hypothetical protein